MSQGDRSAGRSTLLAALEKLLDVDVGSAAPAVGFRPVAWSRGDVPDFDLARAAGLPGPRRPGPGPESASSLTGATDADARTDGAARLPEPCPGVVETLSAVNRGDLDPRELLEGVIRRIEALGAPLNALVTPSFERAREAAERVVDVLQAGERARPLAGVPLVHKDVICTAGTRTTAGSLLLAGHVPEHDAEVVARLENAGTLLLGKSNTHEFATGTTGTVSAFGAVKNPWDRSRMAGGSSSGSAAAVAAGLVAAATGTDTGGSIRIPSACCGTVGLKPSYGRVSRAGVVPFAWSLDHIGPMARSVEDAAALLTAMAGHDPRDPTSVNEPVSDFRSALSLNTNGLRFAIPGAGFLDASDPAVAEAVSEAGVVFERLGARRVDVEMPAELGLVGPIAIAIFLAEGGALHRRTLTARPDDYQEETRAFLQLADRVTGPAYVQAQRARARLCDAFAHLFRSIDLLLTPALPVTAPKLDAEVLERPSGPADVRAVLTSFTRPFNLTGLPALSLPCGFDDDGLPIGLQVVGRPFDEATVLRAAHAYQQSTAWTDRRPAGFGG